MVKSYCTHSSWSRDREVWDEDTQKDEDEVERNGVISSRKLFVPLHLLAPVEHLPGHLTLLGILLHERSIRREREMVMVIITDTIREWERLHWSLTAWDKFNWATASLAEYVTWLMLQFTPIYRQIRVITKLKLHLWLSDLFTYSA